MLKLVEETSPILHTPASRVENFNTHELAEKIEALFSLLKTRKDGVALAAPQAGIHEQIFIISPDLFKAPDTHDLVFINPTITYYSPEKVLMEEGCLSVPYVFGKTKRSIKVTIEAYRPNGTKFSKTGTGLLAQIFQHETDHLHGILFNSHATHLHELDREEIERFENEDYTINPMY